MSSLVFARTVQALFLFTVLCLLFLPDNPHTIYDEKTALLIIVSLQTAMIILGFKCRRCGRSVYATENYRINLLVPASRTCTHCQSRRS